MGRRLGDGWGVREEGPNRLGPGAGPLGIVDWPAEMNATVRRMGQVYGLGGGGGIAGSVLLLSRGGGHETSNGIEVLHMLGWESEHSQGPFVTSSKDER